MPLGDDSNEGMLAINPAEAETVCMLFRLCLELGPCDGCKRRPSASG